MVVAGSEIMSLFSLWESVMFYFQISSNFKQVSCLKHMLTSSFTFKIFPSIWKKLWFFYIYSMFEFLIFKLVCIHFWEGCQALDKHLCCLNLFSPFKLSSILLISFWMAITFGINLFDKIQTLVWIRFWFANEAPNWIEHMLSKIEKISEW